MIDEAGVLVGEAVVVLSPDMAREEVVQRGDRPAPGYFCTGLQPLRVLVEHRVHDVDEGLVAVEEPMATAEKVALQPTLTLMFGKYLHHATFGSQVVVLWDDLGVPRPVGDLENVL